MRFKANCSKLMALLPLLAFSGCAGEGPRPDEAPPAQVAGAEGDQGTGNQAPTATPPTAPTPQAPRALDPPPPGPNDTAGDPRLGDFAQEMALQEQEKAALAENYFRTGKNLFQQLRYREAYANLQRAVALNPNHAEAAALRDRCGWILGDRRAEYRDAVRELVDERLARIDQARVEMERIFNEGELLMQRQRYEEAQERFARVLEAIKWFPYDIDRGDFRSRAEGRIADARRLAEEQERHRRQLLQEAARQAAEHEKANSRRFVEATLRALLEDAREALRVGKFDKCERLCDDILVRRPDHAEAQALRAEAIEQRHRRTIDTNYRERVEHWRRQFEWVEASAIPYQQIFQFPDREEWLEIAARDVPLAEQLARRRGGPSEEVLEITRRLESQQITLNFDQTPFDEAINFLRDITGLNYVLTGDAQDLVENESVTVSLRLRNITLKNALSLILASNETLTYRIENGVIKIGTTTDQEEELLLEFYDVTEIVNTPPDFPAPDLGLSLASGGGGGGGGAGGGVLSFDEEEEDTGANLDSDKLVEIIESQLGEDEGGSVEYSAGILIVRKSLRAHENIVKLLDALRRQVGVMVTVEARFIQVQDNYLEHIGIDLANQQNPIAPDSFGSINNPRAVGSGPGNTQVGYNYTDAQGQSNFRGAMLNALSSLAPAGLPFNISPLGGIAMQYNFLETFQIQAILEAVRKTQKAKTVNAPRITVFNGQRSHVLSISQRAYIQDVEVNQTGVIPVLNPVIGILNSGAILEVRPTVSHDRRYVTLEVKPTLATELQPRIPAPVTLAGGFTSIPIELPVITIQKLRSTVTIPDGGTVLLGGLKNFDEFEGVSGIPLLMHIPLLNNFARRQAFHKLKSSLVVLIKADITIIREEEQNLFGRD
jgi:type II secretory pathway component GspD/PulD (secretin)